jgi:anti-sigma factor RsiW
MRCSLLVLSSYLDGELDAPRRGEVDGHLVGCDRCRNAFNYLQEEAERIGSLARVRVPDEAIHGFMAQLGLIGPDETLPSRPSRRPAAVASGTPPWLEGRTTGTSLPWAPRRVSEAVAADGNQPSLPFTTDLPVNELFRLVSPRADPSREEDGEAQVNLNGRSTLAAGVPRIPLVVRV